MYCNNITGLGGVGTSKGYYIKTPDGKKLFVEQFTVKFIKDSVKDFSSGKWSKMGKEWKIHAKKELKFWSFLNKQLK